MVLPVDQLIRCGGFYLFILVSVDFDCEFPVRGNQTFLYVNQFEILPFFAFVCEN